MREGKNCYCVLFRVIDCTGDADIAYMAGAEYRKTGELTFVKKKQKYLSNQEMRIFHSAKSEMMGMTTVFNASGVDKENFVKYTEENPATYRVPDLNIFTKSFCRDGLSHLFCLA